MPIRSISPGQPPLRDALLLDEHSQVTHWKVRVVSVAPVERPKAGPSHRSPATTPTVALLSIASLRTTSSCSRTPIARKR